jgi:hypothetical protein
MRYKATTTNLQSASKNMSIHIQSQTSGIKARFEVERVFE